MSPRLEHTSSAWRAVAIAAVFVGLPACDDAPLASAPAPVAPSGAVQFSLMQIPRNVNQNSGPFLGNWP